METIDLALDGALPAAEARRLEAHLAACDGCREEQRLLLSLRQALGEATIAVRDGFHSEVMGALPVAGWQEHRTAAPHRTFGRAAMLLVALAAASALVLTFAGDGGPLGGPLAAVVGLAGAALVAGAGLLGASWSGLGMAIGEMFSQSPLTALGFAVLLGFLTLLLIGMLKRPRPAAERSRSD